MSETTTETTSGIGFFGLLTIVFITLKLTDFIAWSWWMVLLPLWWWIPLLIVGGIGYILFSVLTK